MWIYVISFQSRQEPKKSCLELQVVLEYNIHALRVELMDYL